MVRSIATPQQVRKANVCPSYQTSFDSKTVEEQLPIGTSRLNKLAEIYQELLAFQTNHVYYLAAGVWTELRGPQLDPIFDAGDANSVIVDSFWQDQLFLTTSAFSSPQKIFKDSLGIFRLRNAGLPYLPAGVSVANPTGTGSTYLYAFHFSYAYTVGTVDYLDFGPVYFYPTQVTGGAITTGNGANIPLPITIGGSENWNV